jgi:hypothetical protein
VTTDRLNYAINMQGRIIECYEISFQVSVAAVTTRCCVIVLRRIAVALGTVATAGI